MSASKLYTEAEIKEAMIVGVGLGGVEKEADAHEKIDAALAIFTGAHGRELPNFDHFRHLAGRREYGAMAEAHLAAGEMLQGQESLRHAALGQLAALIGLGKELGDAAQVVVRA